MNVIHQIDPSIEPAELTDEQLLLAHMTTHSYYKEFRLGREKENWTFESVVQTHDDIKDEIQSRDELEHEYVNALDSESVEATQGLEVQMGHKDTVAKEWAEDLLQADDVDQHIRENPPDTSWYPKAAEFVQEEDETLDITEYVEFAAQSHNTLEESVQEWIQEAVGAEVDAVGYYFNESTETGVLFVKDEDVYQVYADSVLLQESDGQIESLETYNETVSLVQDGVRANNVESALQGEDEWDVNTDGEFIAENEEENWGRVRQDGELLADEIEELRLQNASGETPVPPNYRDRVENALDELRQGRVVGSDVQYAWYVWEQEEAEAWLQGHGFDTPEPTRQDGHLTYVQREDGELFDTFTEYRGPMHHYPTDVPQVDGRPKLFRMGYPNETPQDYETAVVQSVSFRVERPIAGEEVQQYEATVTVDGDGEVKEIQYGDEVEQIDVAEAEKDWHWYLWDRNEINVWLQEREYDAGVGQQDGNFLRVEVNNSEGYDEFKTAWQGRREKPSEASLAGGEKPRKVTYGVTPEGDKEIHKVEFKVE